ncbi:MAG: hypothetical protein FWF51_00825 [Chitinivibrionia bacterium]|nr:hypothetical protein [Chitinivibrionia bacterium]
MRLIKNNFLDNDEYERMPILFTPFCRVETATKVFAAIRKSKPKKLYVFSDGWREEKDGEKEKVQYLRQYVTENVDWDCQVFTKFESKNLGTRFGIESAIDWFFENEEMGIILEDDCLPAPSFFRFCAEMLVKYKDEEKIFLINGTNESSKKSSANSYSFRRIYDIPEDVTQLWGWGSWRRAWKKHDKKMSKLQEYKNKCEYQNTSDNDEYLKNKRISVLVNQMEHILSDENKTWDLQFKFSILTQNGLFIIPDCNLVTNIGCGASVAAHGAFEYIIGGTLIPGEFLFPALHPSQILPQILSTKECLRAAYMSIFKEKEFWDMETRISNEILDVHNFLVKSSLSSEQFSKMFEPFISEKLHTLINISAHFKEFGKAQKYLYLSLTRSLLRGEYNICSKCEKRECLSVCPSNCISLFQTQEKEIVVNIDRKICQYCFNCVKSCGAIKQK